MTRAGRRFSPRWLETSRLNERDGLLVFSVGGGDAGRGISVNIVKAIDLAKTRGAKVFGIVGRETGHTAQRGDVVVVVPEVNSAHVTPLSEAFQAVVWHCLVSNPDPADRAHDMVTEMAEGARRAVFLDRDGVLVVPTFRDGRSYAPTLACGFPHLSRGARQSSSG